jgi:hypothetical protein
VTVGLDTPVTDVETIDDRYTYRVKLVHVMASEPMKANRRVVSDIETDSGRTLADSQSHLLSPSAQSIHR